MEENARLILFWKQNNMHVFFKDVSAMFISDGSNYKSFIPLILNIYLLERQVYREWDRHSLPTGLFPR